MKRKSAPLTIRYFSILLVLIVAASAAFAQAVLPTPTGFVNDYAGVLDAATKQRIEKRLREFKEKSNPQVELAVAIVDTTGDRPIFDYSLQMAREWKIGSKQDDNPSALLLVAISDRKYFTQVGRDLEDELPDGLAGQIQRQYLVPEFKNRNYGKGIEDTMDAYIRTIEAKQTGAPPPQIGGTKKEPRESTFSVCNVIFCGLLLFVVLIIIFATMGGGRGGKNKRDDDRWGGGSGGGGSDVLPWLAGAVIGNILSGSSSGSSSSDWGGSSDWGSGSNGGDWGGFGGGGDFGGGGAGGDW